MNTERLLKLADFLDDLAPEKFDFSRVIHRCGTVGCAIGWTATVFPELVGLSILEEQDHSDEKDQYTWKTGVKWLGTENPGWAGHNYAWVAEKLFDISMQEGFKLFTCDQRRQWTAESSLDALATPKEVAQSIRQFIAWKSPVAVPEPVLELAAV